MNRDRLLDTAMSTVVTLAADYRVQRRTPLAMPGRALWAKMCDWLRDKHEKGYLTPHDVTTGAQIAMIVTGGDIDEGTELSENELLALERKAFLTLGQTDQTRDRIQFMLEHGTPLRN
jgi:3-hydroxyacyl-CoA dehydrogenase